MLLQTRRSFLGTLAFVIPIAQRREAAAPIFTFESDELWLNLHHFLYVLGRAENQAPDAGRQAVAGVRAEAARGLAGLSEADQRVWREAVAAYAGGHSRRDILFDEPLLGLTAALARVDEAATLAEVGPALDALKLDAVTLDAMPLDVVTRAMLERVAPIYRRGWWASHRDGNRVWRAGVRPLIDRHGAAVLAFITRAYQLRWPAAGYPVHLSAFTNWAGAYSTGSGLLMVATNAGAGNPDLLALESVFHEGMHQWDRDITAALRVQEQRVGQKAPELLWHALIFYTAGEAVRQVAPDHVPYAQANGVWNRGMGRMKPALDAVWKPYLDGRGARDEALAALVERTARG